MADATMNSLFARNNLENVRHRILAGIHAGVIGQILHAANRLLLAPLFLSAWDTPTYGEWLMLTSFAAYLSLIEFGGQTYIVNLLTQATARHDDVRFRQVLHTGLASFLVIPSAGLAIFLLGLAWLPIEQWFRLTMIDENAVRSILALLALQTAMAIPCGLLTGIYRAIGLFPRGIMLGNSITFLQLMLVAAALWLDQGPTTVAMLQLLPLPFIALIAILDLGKLLPRGTLAFQQASLRTATSFFLPSLHFFSIQLSQALSIQGALLIVGGFLGPIQAAAFATIRTATNLAKQLFGLVAHATWPELTRADALGNRRQLVLMTGEVLRVTMLVSCATGLALHVFGSDLIQFWTRGKLEFTQELLDLFLLIMLVSTFWAVCGNTLAAINKHSGYSKVLLAHATSSVGLAWIGARHAGIEGATSGILLAEIALPLWAIPYLLTRTAPEFGKWFFLREGCLYATVPALTLISPWMGLLGLTLLISRLSKPIKDYQ